MKPLADIPSHDRGKGREFNGACPPKLSICTQPTRRDADEAPLRSTPDDGFTLWGDTDVEPSTPTWGARLLLIPRQRSFEPTSSKGPAGPPGRPMQQGETRGATKTNTSMADDPFLLRWLLARPNESPSKLPCWRTSSGAGVCRSRCRSRRRHRITFRPRRC